MTESKQFGHHKDQIVYFHLEIFCVQSAKAGKKC